MKTPKERFEKKYIPVPESGCWLWTEGISKDGYGKFSIKYKDMRAHRFAWELYRWPIPKDMCVLHKCDVKTCVNPDHLFIGTYGDNNRDRAIKGRSRNQNGELNNCAKLSSDEVDSIRILYATTLYTHKSIAKMYNVTRENVRDIINGKIWKHTYAN